MKTARIKILSWYNVLITALLAVLGFACSCDPKVEYGTPSAKFIVNGKVTSSETNQPIGNIRVIMQRDTSYTNTDGVFQVVDNWGFPVDQPFNIQFQDVDGEINKEFNDLDTIVEFKNSKFSGGDGHWYSGETSIDFDVKMTPKQ